MKRIFVDYIDDEHFTSEIGRDLFKIRRSEVDVKDKAISL